VGTEATPIQRHIKNLKNIVQSSFCIGVASVPIFMHSRRWDGVWKLASEKLSNICLCYGWPLRVSFKHVLSCLTFLL
jgi:hypothetical protein